MPVDVGDDVQRAVRRFLASAPSTAGWLLRARDRVARLLDQGAERHAAGAEDERPSVVSGSGRGGSGPTGWTPGRS